MKKTTIIWYCILMSFQSMALASDRTIILTRTNVGLATDENQLIISSNQKGNIELTFPKYHIYYGNVIKFNHHQKSEALFSKARSIKYHWNINELKLKLKEIKNNLNDSLFYSSDSDIISLSVLENGQIIWQITIDNLQELKHFYTYLDQWQSLVDVIENMESLSRRSLVSKQMESQNEK